MPVRSRMEFLSDWLARQGVPAAEGAAAGLSAIPPALGAASLPVAGAAGLASADAAGAELSGAVSSLFFWQAAAAKNIGIRTSTRYLRIATSLCVEPRSKLLRLTRMIQGSD